MDFLFSRDFQYFLKCVEKGSFTAAAKSLYVSQSAVSMAISRLEQDTGFSLFLRSPGSTQIKLTDRATLLLKEMNTLRSQFNGKMGEVLGDKFQNPLRIGVSVHLGAKYLNPILSQLQDKIGKVHVYHMRAQILQDAFEGRQIDFMLASLPKKPAVKNSKRLDSDTLYYMGLKEKFPLLDKAKTLADIERFPRLYATPAYDQNFYSTLPVNQTAFYIDDNFSAREIILSGLAIDVHFLEYYSQAELSLLAFSPYKPKLDKFNVYLAWQNNLTKNIQDRIDLLYPLLEKEFYRERKILLENFSKAK